MSLVIDSGFNYDADASAYIDAVETADGQALETATRYAINDFVIGCKQDGIWSAIKASCILAGARTLAGCLVPLAGTAPTNFNFVAGDYNRKTGLVGNGSTKYLNSNRNQNADPQNNVHLSVFLSTALSSQSAAIGSQTNPPNVNSLIFHYLGNLQVTCNSGSGGEFGVGQTSATNFIGVARSSASQIQRRVLSQSTSTNSNNSLTPGLLPFYVFGRNLNGSLDFLTSARISFYSIGESLDLALLDARVTALMSAFAAAIP